MEQRKSLPLDGRSAGLAFTAVVIINLFVSLIVSALISLPGIKGTDGAKYVSYLVSPVAIALTLVLALKSARQGVKSLLPVKTHPKYLLIGLLLIFGLLFSLNSLNDWLIKLFELMGYTRKASTLPDVSGWKVVPALIVVAVIPAVMEEIMFRGIILNNAEEGLGSVRTVFAVGLCFSLYHGSVEQTLYQFICGCLFAFLAIRSRSITPTVVIHFINNALIIVLYACGAVDAETGSLLVSGAGEIVLYVLSGISLIGAIVWLVLDKTPLKPCKKGEVAAFFLYGALGIGVMVALWIAGLFV